MPDQTFGPYRVLDKLGEGGMGVVYRARDTRLDRDVALKVLPELVSSDPDRLARFEREARVLASLNHPHIAQVYGFERESGRQAIAMELVEGPTLAELVAGAPGRGLPLDRALAIARQIADALEAAHDQGIVHRDLKPANVKVRDDGAVKVLDFGLAKGLSAGDESSGPNAANSPTLTARATELGVILGTAAYMAPEQAKGKRVDKRADVWAFGVVLFEMLSGERAFEGEDVSDTLASVLAREPRLAALPAGTPAPVRRLIGRCLEKDPKTRLRDIGDAMRRLDEELAAPPAAPVRAAGSRAGLASAGQRFAIPALALVVGVASGSMLWRGAPGAPEPRGVVRFSYVPPAGDMRVLQSPNLRDVTIAPDGSVVLFRWAGDDGRPSFAVRRMDEEEAVTLRGTEAAGMAFFAPDGQSLGLLLQGAIARVAIGGGRQQILAEVQMPPVGATWSEDGRIIFGRRDGGLRAVAATGGAVEDLTTPTEAMHVWPSVLPGGRAVVFVEAQAVQTPGEQGRLKLLDLTTREVTDLGLDGTSPKYVATGHLVYATPDASLWAVPFDLGRLTVSGRAAPVLDQVLLGPSGAADFDVSDDGRLVYLVDPGAAVRRLAWVDRAGAATFLPAPPRSYSYAWLSPDERELAVDIRDEGRDIWVYDIARNTLQRRTVTPTDDEYGLWTADGASLVYSNQVDLFRVAANGASGPEPITRGTAEARMRFPNAITPDGRVIFRGPGTTGSGDLFVVPLDGSADPAPLLASEFEETNAAVSPDGTWLAYQSDQTGRTEVFVRPLADVNADLHQISNAGGQKPAWSRDGRELFYLTPTNQMMRVAVAAGSRFSASVPEPLFDASRFFFGTVGRNYDVARDGRFIMIDTDRSGRPQSLSFAINWFDVLREIR